MLGGLLDMVKKHCAKELYRVIFNQHMDQGIPYPERAIDYQGAGKFEKWKEDGHADCWF